MCYFSGQRVLFYLYCSSSPPVGGLCTVWLDCIDCWTMTTHGVSFFHPTEMSAFYDIASAFWYYFYLYLYCVLSGKWVWLCVLHPTAVHDVYQLPITQPASVVSGFNRELVSTSWVEHGDVTCGHSPFPVETHYKYKYSIQTMSLRKRYEYKSHYLKYSFQTVE